jgi:spore germination protein GerM
MTASPAATTPGPAPTPTSAATTPTPTRGSAAHVFVYFAHPDLGDVCEQVFPVARAVERADPTAALTQLLAGPTEIERALGYQSWFSTGTAGLLRTVSLSSGVATVDLGDISRVIPNASSSCGSHALLGALDATLRQFPSITRACYAIEGEMDRFYGWLQYDTCRP